MGATPVGKHACGVERYGPLGPPLPAARMATADAAQVREVLQEVQYTRPGATEYTTIWVGEIEPRNASKTLGELNKRRPLRSAGLEYLKSMAKNLATQKLEVFYGRTPEGAEDFGIGPMREVTVAGIFPATPEEWKEKNKLWPFTKPAPPPIPTLPRNMPDGELAAIHANYERLVNTAVAKSAAQYAYVVNAAGEVLAEFAGGWGGAYVDVVGGGETANGGDDPLCHCITGLIDAFSESQNNFDRTAFRKRTKDEQYLLTNLDVYTVQEPCVMCAMSLLHSRCGRVFYLNKNTKFGGAGSVHNVHAEPNLNHHFPAYSYPREDLQERLRRGLLGGTAGEEVSATPAREAK